MSFCPQVSDSSWVKYIVFQLVKVLRLIKFDLFWWVPMTDNSKKEIRSTEFPELRYITWKAAILAFSATLCLFHAERGPWFVIVLKICSTVARELLHCAELSKKKIFQFFHEISNIWTNIKMPYPSKDGKSKKKGIWDKKKVNKTKIVDDKIADLNEKYKNVSWTNWKKCYESEIIFCSSDSTTNFENKNLYLTNLLTN